MSNYRTCDHPNGYPICACCEGLIGHALNMRSAWLSSLCGWPNPIADDDLVVAVLAENGQPILCDYPADWPWPPVPDPPEAPRQLAQAMPPATPSGSGGGCGCGKK